MPCLGKICSHCKNKNYFATVCQIRNDNVNTLIAHVTYQSETNSYNFASTNNTEEITVFIQPLLPHKDIPPISFRIFSGIEASICLAGIEHLSPLNLLQSDLIPCWKKVTATGGSTHLCKGWLPVCFTINNQTTKQPLYFSNKVTCILAKQVVLILTYTSIVSISNANSKKINHRANFRIYTAPTIPLCTEPTISPQPNKIQFTAIAITNSKRQLPSILSLKRKSLTANFCCWSFVYNSLWTFLYFVE